jgi:Trk-type K+ transport system membrane component
MLTVSGLVVLGGIGFPILENFMRVIGFYLKNIIKKIVHHEVKLRRSPHLWNLNSMIVLRTTALLLVVGTLGFAIFEWNNFQGSTLDRLVMSFFMSVNPRTSGFGVTNIGELCMPSLVLITFLMWIGGASQSTAGGIKVNTIAVAVINLWAVIRERRKVEVFGRELNQASVNRANATILMSILVLGVAVFVLTILEPQMGLKELFYEAMAALTTVGLGFGVTDQLGMASRIVVAILMFVGRIGLITLILGVVKREDELDYDFPKDDVIIT